MVTAKINQLTAEKMADKMLADYSLTHHAKLFDQLVDEIMKLGYQPKIKIYFDHKSESIKMEVLK